MNLPISDLMVQATETADRLRDLRSAKPDERTPEWASDLRNSTLIMRAVDAEIAAAERAAGARVTRTDTPEGPTWAFQPAAGAEPEAPRTAGAEFAENAAVRSFISANGGKGTSPEVQVRTLLTSLTGDTSAAGTLLPKGQPFLANVRQRRLFVRDMIATGQTTLSSIPYVRELAPTTNDAGASSVAEGVAKPEVQMQFTPQDAPVRKIAGWLPATEEILADAPTLRSYIDARLAYMVLLREEEQVLNGSGNGSDLRGIRQTTGLQTQAAVAGDVPATIGRAIGLVENVDMEADGVAMNPTDFWTSRTTRYANQFDDGFGQGAPYNTPNGAFWGLTTVRTRSMPAGRALVGAWRMGAQLFERSGVVIKTSDSHASYFIENRVAILAEERVALAIYRPDGFVECTIA